MFVWIFLTISLVSAIVEDEFTIIRDSTAENCKICYGFDCTTLRKPRCEYYGEVYASYANIDDYEPEDNDLNDEVGNMLLQYVDKASTEPYEDCLPLISQYTTCNKDNICVDCKICSCNVYGRWNCSSVQRCLKNDPLIADHRTLVVVMEKLRRYINSHSNERFKRSTNEINQDSKISYEDLLTWLYGIEGFENAAQNKTEMSIKITNTNTHNDVSKKQTNHTNSESDLLSFNDLLNSAMEDDNLDINTNHTGAILYKSNDPITFDLLKEIGAYYDTEAGELNIPNGKPENKTTASLKTAISNIRENENVIFSLNDVKENIINIKKRDIPSDANETDILLPINYNNTIDKMEELQKNIVFSLNKNINSHSNERFKRSTNEINQDSKISYEDLLTWLYGIEGFENAAQNKTEMSIKITNTNTHNDVSKKQTNHTNSESDLLSFNDLLNSAMEDDNLDINTNHTGAILYKSNDPITFDLLKEIGAYYDTEAGELNIPNGKPENKTTASLKTAISNIRENENVIFSLNDVKENIINIKKRDIPSDANETDILLPINYNNTIDKMEELQKNIVFSLNKIVNEKQNELKKLTNIKEKLILYLKTFGNISIPNDISNDSKYNENPIIHLYQFEANQPNEVLRKHDPNILEKYLKKLKRDIFEVIRDIAGIQKLSNTSMPHNLNVLVRSMKYYVNEENKKSNITKHNKVNFRKQFNSHDTNERNNRLVDIIINILEVLDRDAPTNDVLVTVSPNLRRILKRLIGRFYSEDFDISDTKLFKPKYNILSYLTSIENKWQNLIPEIGQSSIQERLYNLKSLHIALSKDILTINNALKFVEFANHRRMTTNSQVLGEKVVSKLTNDLHQMKNRIKQMIKLKPNQRFKNKNKNNVKKKSIFQKIKKMLKISKKELRKLFHKNVTNAEVLRHMAREKMDEMNKKKMSEYEEIMQRWQNNLNIMSARNKRSAGEFRKFMYKIKHIFAPRYSRSRAKTIKPLNNKNGFKVTTKKTKYRGHSKNKKVVSTTSKTVLFKKIKHNN
ncbi:GATA zinc finger domain-containing protein 14-like [Nymphalis io]|uniref:GATA zinc finger domain-containing protein 14-like n=1 Tax=Inachis io TaxID=171585 RepID=UPI00216A556B|nr:GATA zinc finger domain-containing protein 14-like [Nymphalis io]